MTEHIGPALEPPTPLGAIWPTIRTALWTVLPVALLIGLTAGPRVMKVFAESKVDVAKLHVRKYADEAYPQWLRDHPRSECPTLVELNDYMDMRSNHDPWGSHYAIRCVADRPIISSPGEDRRYGTGDDISSNNL